MILVDAIFINNGGGKILLDYLVEEIERKKLQVFFLFDERCSDFYHNIDESRKLYLKSSLFKRHIFYKTNKHRFTKVFCFGNLPPSIKLPVPVYTYFHQQIFLNTPNEYSLNTRFLISIKKLVLLALSQNTSYWLVQTQTMKYELAKKIKINSSQIKSIPFYPKMEIVDKRKREKNTYIYASNASPHKNHLRLINAFCVFFDKYKLGKLILTVNKHNIEIYNLIEERRKLGYNILNIGVVDRNLLQTFYSETEYLIFPSLAESFGLGLIEAIECGCKAIVANMPYSFEVCEPSIVFDPYDEKSLFHAFEQSLSDNIEFSVPKIQNNIGEILNILCK